MIVSFDAHVCAIETLEDINTLVIILADQAPVPTHSVELQRSIDHDDQDATLGMDTYCATTISGATHYGGIDSCILTEDTLSIAFSNEAEIELGLSGYLIRLFLDVSDKNLLKVGLKKLFDQDKFAPKNLVI